MLIIFGGNVNEEADNEMLHFSAHNRQSIVTGLVLVGVDEVNGGVDA